MIRRTKDYRDRQQRREFYEYYGDDAETLAYAGHPGACTQVMPYGVASIATSLNNHGVVAGLVVGLKGVQAVFTGDQGVYTGILPPGAQASFDGFNNDSGQIAGLHENAKARYRGFVYTAGAYVRFANPGASNEVTIQAFNNSGLVVGVYTDAAHTIQRGFLFNGTTVSVFGEFPAGDQVSIWLNDEGTMLLSDDSPALGTATTWRVLCGGEGC